MNFKSRRGQSGIAVLDLIIYTVLAAGLLYAVFSAAKVASAKTSNADEAQQFLLMSADVAIAYGKSQGNFAGVTVAQILAHNLAPQKMINGTALQTSAWNTPVTVTPASLTGATADALAWNYQVPRTECSEFVSTVASAMAKVTVGGTVVKDIPNAVQNVNMTSLGTACNATAGTGNVALVLTRGK
jgi:hypothetical protein